MSIILSNKNYYYILIKNNFFKSKTSNHIHININKRISRKTRQESRIKNSIFELLIHIL